MAYDNGLQGAHLFINVPPEERAPGHVNNADHNTIKAHIELYNSILEDYVAAFAERNPGASVLTFDAHSWFNEVLDNAAAYGFSNITGYVRHSQVLRGLLTARHRIRYCTCTDSSYFWYNTGHPTEHVHRLLAEAIEDSLKNASRLSW